MKLLALNCEHCGAPLEVPPKVRFVACNYCSARLEVHRSGSSAYTEVLETIDTRTEQIARDVEYLKRQKELEDLDRAWTLERAKYMVRGNDGELSVPSKGSSAVIGSVVVAFGIFWTITAGALFPPMAIFGVLFVGFAIFAVVSGVRKAEEYERRHRLYEQKRRALLRDMRRGDA
jgi:uncharacterized Zn finger protein (UPF0148 family)